MFNGELMQWYAGYFISSNTFSARYILLEDAIGSFQRSTIRLSVKYIKLNISVLLGAG